MQDRWNFAIEDAGVAGRREGADLRDLVQSGQPAEGGLRRLCSALKIATDAIAGDRAMEGAEDGSIGLGGDEVELTLLKTALQCQIVQGTCKVVTGLEKAQPFRVDLFA